MSAAPYAPLVQNDTPWEDYMVDGVQVWVKREDLCAPSPGPEFSKVRGLEQHLLNLREEGVTAVGVLDTLHSKAGWGTAWLCQNIGLTCFCFYPIYKAEKDGALRFNQTMAARFGAQLIPLKAGRQSILWHSAKKSLESMYPGGVLLPNGLAVPESIRANAREVIDFTPPELTTGTWVISVSSGHIARGVARGLADFMVHHRQAILMGHLGYSRSVSRLEAYIDYYNLQLVDEGYEYKDRIEFPCPFPTNPWYDAKAWKWLTENVRNLRPPVIFWNIGK